MALRHTFTIIGDCPTCGEPVFDGFNCIQGSDRYFYHKKCYEKLDQKNSGNVAVEEQDLSEEQKISLQTRLIAEKIEMANGSLFMAKYHLDHDNPSALLKYVNELRGHVRTLTAWARELEAMHNITGEEE